jgi:DNA-binding LacI/PurR family transcriptional regulator
MAANIRDVAKLADVSITTVSHVMSGRGRVASATRERVLTAIADLNYQANIHAQRLVSQKSRTLAFQIASFTQNSSSTTLIPNSNYFLEVLNAASNEAARREYVLLILSAVVDPSLLDRYGIDGVLIIDPRGDEQIFQTDSNPEWLIVTNGRIGSEFTSHIGVVDNDHRRTTRETLEHLRAEGYERPALITTDLGRSYTRDLADEYRDWCKEEGLTPIIVELPEPPTQQAAAKAARKILARRNPPDAILASAEDLALGVLHAAQDQGLSVPKDLGIVSAVDSSVLLVATPSITAVYLDPETTGISAVNMLISALEDHAEFPQRVIVPSELRIRDSTSRRSARGEA